MSHITDAIKAVNSNDLPDLNNLPEIDKLSLDEIRQLAEKEANESQETQSKSVAIPESGDNIIEEGEDQPESQVFRKEIDLGDGSGVQVFEADSLEGLVDKLAKAQENATRKIRELNTELKTKQPQQQKEPPKERTFTPDEEFVFSQEMMSKPTAAVKKIFKELVGVDINEFRTTVERINAVEAAQRQQKEEAEMEAQKAQAASNFMAAHPEYVANQTNGTRLTREVNSLINEERAAGREIDYASLLVKAYRDLSESGLLEIKSQEVTEAKEQTGTGKPRIEKPVEVVPSQRPRKASNILPKGRTVAPPKSTGPSEKELYEMPLEQLRELANQQAREA